MKSPDRALQGTTEQDQETIKSEQDGSVEAKKEISIQEKAEQAQHALLGKYESLTGSKELQKTFVIFTELYRNMAREMMANTKLINPETYKKFFDIYKRHNEISSLTTLRKYGPENDIPNEALDVESNIISSVNLTENGWINPSSFMEYVSNEISNVAMKKKAAELEPRAQETLESMMKPGLRDMEKSANRAKYETFFRSIMSPPDEALSSNQRDWKERMLRHKNETGKTVEEIFDSWINNRALDGLESVLLEDRNRGKNQKDIEAEKTLVKADILG